MTKKRLAAAFLTLSLFGAGACPEGGLPMPGVAPSLETWVRFTVNAPGSQQASRGSTLRHSIRVDDKAQVNAGVEFEVRVAPAGLIAAVVPARLSETGRDTELVVEIPAGAAIGEYTVTVRAHLTFTGGSAPDWSEAPRTVNVITGEGGFSMFCDPTQLTLAAGQAQTLVPRTIRENGFGAPIDLSFGPHPEFLTINPATARVEANQVGFAFTVSRSPQIIAPPTFSLIVIGRSGSIERRVTVPILMPSAAAGR